jgi:hypothetical protein
MWCSCFLESFFPKSKQVYFSYGPTIEVRLIQRIMLQFKVDKTLVIEKHSHIFYLTSINLGLYIFSFNTCSPIFLSIQTLLLVNNMVLANMTNISELIWMNIWAEIIREERKNMGRKKSFFYCLTKVSGKSLPRV